MIANTFHEGWRAFLAAIAYKAEGPDAFIHVELAKENVRQPYPLQMLGAIHRATIRAIEAAGDDRITKVTLRYNGTDRWSVEWMSVTSDERVRFTVTNDEFELDSWRPYPGGGMYRNHDEGASERLGAARKVLDSSQ